MSSRIKGVSLINTLAILGEVLGGNRFQTLAWSCPQETQQLIRRTLVAGEWIPLEVWAPFVHAIYEQVFRQDEVQFRRLLRAVCKRDFSTVYRQYITQITPEELLDKVGSIWSAYFDSGSLSRIANPEPQGEPITLQMRDLETSFSVYAVAMHAYLEQVMAMVGARSCVVTRTNEQLRDGKLSCDFLIDLHAPAAPPTS